jgi:hypothetical protein
MIKQSFLTLNLLYNKFDLFFLVNKIETTLKYSELNYILTTHLQSKINLTRLKHLLHLLTAY